MNIGIVYSSVTGNTRRLAEGIARELADLHPVLADAGGPEALPEAEVYLVGYWADKGRPDERASAFLKQLRSVRVGLFGTLGACPYGPHARMIQAAAEELLDESCTLIGSFLCQGPVDPGLLARMRQPDRPVSAETRCRHRIAAGHPNAEDMHYAAGLFRERLCTAADADGYATV